VPPPVLQSAPRPAREGREIATQAVDRAHQAPAAHGGGGSRRPKTLREKLLGPGWYRAALGIAIGIAFGFGLDVLLRALNDYKPLIDGNAITTVCLISTPFGFLIGLGAFDYWFRWASGAPTLPEDHSGHGAYSWRDYFRVNTDHKVIGLQYICTTFFFFVIGGVMAMLMRAELAAPGQQFVDPNTFNGLFSVHASLMIFLFIIPVFAGIANYVLPLMIGAPDMAFPRLNALSFWLLPIAGVMMLASFFAPGGSFATGWTAYAPLSTQTPLGQTFFSIAVQFAGASSIATALNFLVTIITMRAPGMTFWRMPLLAWANFTTSLLVVIATPFIAGSQFFVLFDRALGTHFFDPSHGGDVLMYQHVFWFYSHPAVYIMMLPGFGIISEVISTHARKPIFGYRMMAFSLMAIVLLGFTVWAHHMFVSGMFPWLRVPMMITTMLIAVPTGIKIFSWLATLWKGVIHLRTPMLFALGFITMFTLGGISGIMLAVIPVDIHVSDTYFVVAHIHYVLFGGSVFTIFAGIYHWFPKMTGRMYDETLGKVHFWLSFVFFNLTFGPMHLVGVDGMPRRVADYASEFATINAIISVSSFLFGLSFLVFVYNILASWRHGPKAPANPWRAHTLEWQVSSPPPVFNFDEVPTVVGGPYEYGVPGAVHGVFKTSPGASDREAAHTGGGSG
jgi:cytochrome c oxidase subunit 1